MPTQNSIVSLIVVFLIVFVTLYVAVIFYTFGTVKDIPQEQTSAAKTLSLVFPFTKYDIDATIQAVNIHWSKMKPCSGNHRDNTRLILYYHRDSLPPDYSEEDLQPVWLNRCFSTIRLAFANLTDEEDTHPAGISIMFYRSILNHQSEFGVSSDIQFTIEADVTPVKKLWIDKMYHVGTTGERYWIKGSMFRGRDWDRAIQLSWWRQQQFYRWGMHINGVAFYSLQDKGFQEFVRNTMRSFPPIKSKQPYDIALHLTYQDQTCGLRSPSAQSSRTAAEFRQCWQYLQATASRIQLTDFVQMLGQSIEWSAIGSAYLVHGANATRSRSLNLLAAKKRRKKV